MADNALHQKLQQGSNGRILNAINNAEALIGRHQIRFPRIAVFGDESTGKSSLMEAICNIPFPRGEHVTTKCATQVRLQRKPGPWSATAWTDGQEGSARRHEISVKSPQQLTAVISDLQKKEIDLANKNNPGRETKFSTVPITISIEAEDVVDLTLVDLPGFFQITRIDKDGSDGKAAAMGARDVERVKTTLLDYLEDKLTILLVVVPANVNLKNANIFGLFDEYKDDITSEELQSLKSRTIYCFTKCDLVGTGPGQQRAPQNIEEVLSNKGDFSAKPHGWYAVINNGSGSHDPVNRLKLDREFEIKYFKSHPPYNSPSLQQRCGTAKLVAKLSSLLADEISKRVPSMLSETESALSLARHDLSELGPLPTEEPDLVTDFHRVVNDVKHYFEQASDGIYGEFRLMAQNMAPNMEEDVLKQFELGRLRKERFQMFKEQLRVSRLMLDDESYLMKLEEKVRGAVDGKLDDVFPVKEVVLDEVRACAKKWKLQAEVMCEDVARLAISCLNVIIDVRAGKYERLPGVLRTFLTEMINEQKMRAHTRMRWHYVDEIVRPNTMVDSFLKAYHKRPHAGLGEKPGNNRDTYVAILESFLPTVEARYIDNVVRTITTHIMDVPSDNPMVRVAMDAQPKYLFIGEKIRGNHKLEDLMKLRGDLSMRRKLVSAKIAELEKLRDALLNQNTAAENVASNGRADQGNGEAKNDGETDSDSD